MHGGTLRTSEKSNGNSVPPHLSSTSACKTSSQQITAFLRYPVKTLYAKTPARSPSGSCSFSTHTRGHFSVQNSRGLWVQAQSRTIRESAPPLPGTADQNYPDNVLINRETPIHRHSRCTSRSEHSSRVQGLNTIFSKLYSEDCST